MAYKRKQYIVDKKFQLGTTFSVIGASFLMVALVIALIAYNANRNNEKLSQVVAVQDNIVQALIYHATELDTKVKESASAVKEEKAHEAKDVKGAKKKKDVKEVKKDDISSPDTAEPKSEIAIGAIAKDHLENIAEMKKMVLYNEYLLWAVVFLIIAQGVVLFILLILKTHRIAGPVYVMSMYLREIIAGRIPSSIRPLRKKDDLQSLYGLFDAALNYLRSGKKLKVVKEETVKGTVKVSRKRK
ncbi:MAG TPA: hypothetical protein VF857_10645 [Spirochaetota bacterium]